MVFDTLGNFGKYVALNPHFASVDAFIKTHRLDELAPGTYPISGNDVVLKIEMAKGKGQDEALLESHRLMIDIQIELQQPETFGISALSNMPAAQYNAENDISFYPDGVVQNYITCPQGAFMIFFPQDVHAPCISESQCFKKAIFKVRCV